MPELRSGILFKPCRRRVIPGDGSLTRSELSRYSQTMSASGLLNPDPLSYPAEHAARFLSKHGVEILIGQSARQAQPGDAAPPPDVSYQCYGVRAQSAAFSGEAVSAARTPQGCAR